MTNREQMENQDFLTTVNVPAFPEYDTKDRIFAALYFLVGYGFIYVFTGVTEFGPLSVFTVFYAAVVLLYLKVKHKTPPAESWFWLAVMLAVGLPLAFWTVLYFGFSLFFILPLTGRWQHQEGFWITEPHSGSFLTVGMLWRLCLLRIFCVRYVCYLGMSPEKRRRIQEKRMDLLSCWEFCWLCRHCLLSYLFCPVQMPDLSSW